MWGGRGAILHLAENHSFELIAGLGEGSNNCVELLSLKLLLIFATEKGCSNLKVYGDSLNVINWIKRTQNCRDLCLQNILLSLWDVMETFDMISCAHVYRENNCQVDSASKEGLQLDTGLWKVKERLGNTAFEYYHRPFIEVVAPQ